VKQNSDSFKLKSFLSCLHWGSSIKISFSRHENADRGQVNRFSCGGYAKFFENLNLNLDMKNVTKPSA
jgi:hypothetical protein